MFKFLVEYIKNPRSVGAVFKSSKNLAKKMVEDINFENCNAIAEFGAGTGVFTQEIIERKKDETIFFVFEINRNFCEILEAKFGNYKNVIIINDSAEHAIKYLKKYNRNKVDYIVSGLPFASLPKTISHNVFKAVDDILTDDGRFLTFQYSKFKFDLFRENFDMEDVSRVMFNIPPAYVLECKKN